MSHSYLRTALISAITTLTLAAPAFAQTAVTGCGVLSAPGPYTAPSGSVFNLGGPGDCITIAGPSITFTADSLVINGPVFPPGGTGIHILATAPNAVVTLTGNTNIGGTAATQALTIGIEDDAANAQLNIQGEIQADYNPIGGTGFGVYLNTVSGTSVVLTTVTPTFGTGISGGTYGLAIVGGAHNSVVSGSNEIGIAGSIVGGTDGILIRNSNHNVINHVGITGGPEGILVDNSPGNTIYNNSIQGNPYGVRVRWNSPNNVIAKNAVFTAGGTDLFQGTHPNTVGCNGDYWADNTGALPQGGPAVNTSNQPCVLTMQAMTAY